MPTKKETTKKETAVAEKRNIQTQRIILKPVITEKSNILTEKENQYVFEVSLNTTKNEIKKAIEDEFKVNVNSVKVIKVWGKKVRYGRTQGKQKNRKKAIVTINKGQKIEIYEGV